MTLSLTVAASRLASTFPLPSFCHESPLPLRSLVLTPCPSPRVSPRLRVSASNDIVPNRRRFEARLHLSSALVLSRVSAPSALSGFDFLFFSAYFSASPRRSLPVAGVERVREPVAKSSPPPAASRSAKPGSAVSLPRLAEAGVSSESPHALPAPALCTFLSPSGRRST